MTIENWQDYTQQDTIRVRHRVDPSDPSAEVRDWTIDDRETCPPEAFHRLVRAMQISRRLDEPDNLARYQQLRRKFRRIFLIMENEND